MKFLALFLFILTAGCSTTDTMMISDALVKGTEGFGKQYTYGDSSTPSKSTDWSCVNKCTVEGFEWGLCKSKCSY